MEKKCPFDTNFFLFFFAGIKFHVCQHFFPICAQLQVSHIIHFFTNELVIKINENTQILVYSSHKKKYNENLGKMTATQYYNM